MKRKFPLQMKQLLDKMGVCCFTEEMQNPLFWAHYAASYSGICIEVRATGDTSHPFCNLMKVRYAEARPIVYGTQTGAFPTVYTKHNWDYVAQYGLCTKSSDWAVEKEWRLWIVERSDSYQPLPPKTLRSIFLGPSIGHEAASFVLEAVKTHQTRVKVFRTALSATDFRVEIGARIH